NAVVREGEGLGGTDVGRAGQRAHGTGMHGAVADRHRRVAVVDAREACRYIIAPGLRASARERARRPPPVDVVREDEGCAAGRRAASGHDQDGGAWAACWRWPAASKLRSTGARPNPASSCSDTVRARSSIVRTMLRPRGVVSVTVRPAPA